MLLALERGRLEEGYAFEASLVLKTATKSEPFSGALEIAQLPEDPDTNPRTHAAVRNCP